MNEPCMNLDPVRCGVCGEPLVLSPTKSFAAVAICLVCCVNNEENQSGLGGKPAAVPIQSVDEPVRPPVAVRPASPANTRQFGGHHYKDVGYEHWDFVHDTNMDYWQGCATKYITRARKHMAGFVLNIEKSIHYVDKREELAADGRQNQARMPTSEQIGDYVAANQLNQDERSAILDIIAGRWGEARAALKAMLPPEPQADLMQQG